MKKELKKDITIKKGTLEIPSTSEKSKKEILANSKLVQSYSKVLKSNKSDKTNKSAKMVVEYTKSHSNISTTSVESGIFEMELDELEAAASSSPQPNIGDTVKQTLIEAKAAKKVTLGFDNIIGKLTPIESLFFFVAPNRNGDHVTHMHEVLIKAFCLENEIYIIQVDSAEKLGQLVGSNTSEPCALVQRLTDFQKEDVDEAFDEENFTSNENILIDYCEHFWKEPVQPIVKLPEK